MTQRPGRLVRYIVHLGKALESLDLNTTIWWKGHSETSMDTVSNDEAKREPLCLLSNSCFFLIAWCRRRQYKKSPSPFDCPDLSEARWAHRSWPISLELLEESEGIFKSMVRNQVWTLIKNSILQAMNTARRLVGSWYQPRWDRPFRLDDSRASKKMGSDKHEITSREHTESGTHIIP